MITEPIWVEMPRTYRDYDEYIKECARARGWNEAMECIFAQELEEENKKITSCWLRESEGDWLCKTCQRREYCEVTRGEEVYPNDFCSYGERKSDE